jgi:beta-carotene ketolase (CrtO type)
MYGFELIYPEISLSHIFPNDHGHVSLYRSFDKTLKSIQKFSDKDARSWNRMFDEYRSNRNSIISALNSPPSVPLEYANGNPPNEDLTMTKIALVGDEYRRRSQSMRSWCDEHFESDEIKAMFGTFTAFLGLSPEDAGGGDLCYLFTAVIQDGGNNVVKGGFVNLPMALARYLKLKCGKIMTRSRVQRILIQNGRAVAVELTNGKIIRAKRQIASSTDPFTSILKLIGKVNIDPDISVNIKRIEWGDAVYKCLLSYRSRYSNSTSVY